MGYGPFCCAHPGKAKKKKDDDDDVEEEEEEEEKKRKRRGRWKKGLVAFN